MSSWFHKETPKEAERKAQRALRGTGRDVEKERRELEKQEKQLEGEIKRLAAKGQRDALPVLAKQLVAVRKQKTRTYGLNAKISAVSSQQKAMGSTAKLAGAMATTAKTMGEMNKRMDPRALAATMADFEKQSALMEMGEETIAESLDSILDGSDDEAESDAVVGQILDEIGLDMKGQLAKAPTAPTAIGQASTAQPSKALTDADLERMLSGLKS